MYKKIKTSLGLAALLFISMALKAQPGRLDLDINTWQKGTYIIEIQSANNVYNQKMIVK